ncbi:MAG TPA: phosphoenolpyruvate carboxylase [Candidatus Methylacidiphilales bacterium]|jgi:phosphoenolpyruvate carboxylase|nr:phosphoenolpyruvate carboxylase [Candidatus Methylacidiphilales bacterium]
MSTLPPEATSETLATQIRELGHILGDTIVKLEGKAIFDLEEKLRLLAKSSRAGDASAEKELRAAVQQLKPAEAARMAMAFTVYFELVNLAEETHRVRILRRRRHAQYAVPGTPPMKETIWAALRELKEQGVPPETVQQILDKLCIELVFTAHPTEAKRRTMLNKLQRLANRLQNPEALIEDEVTGIENPRALEREVTSLWLTDRSRSARPEVTDEVLTGLWYFDTTLWNTVPLLRDELARALADTYPGLKAPKRWITFGSWMGGDRDGNPNVTPAVTANTLMLHRKLALDKLEDSLRELSRLLSVSSRLDGISPELEKLVSLGEDANPKLKALHDRYPHEPYRLVLSALRARLQDAEQSETPEMLLATGGNPAAVKTKDVTEVLEVIAESLKANRGALLAEGELYRLRQQVTLFGLSVARLDLRQHSMRHETAMTELLKSVNLCPDYAALSEEEKLALMKTILAAPAPKLPGGYTPETTDVIGSLAVIKRAIELFGPECAGVYVISMTHDLSDIIEVQVFLHLVGVQLDIAPLFETLDDLEAAPGILNAMFDYEPYRAHLKSRGDHQQIMLGYSDSNKDCGYLTANWALFQAQETIADVCKKRGLTFTLFHGRGGSIARGGGPAAKAILAQPCGCYDAKIRVTEQGEVLSTRYHDPDLAFRIIEQMAYGVLLGAAAARQDNPVPEAWRTAMTEMSKLAYNAYEALVHKDPEFIEFWKVATPIDEIGGLKLGSRPTFRRATKSVEDLRAIPWVFSWMQSRFVFPGWYGLGSALEQFAAKSPANAGLLKTMYRDWMFFKATIDNAQLTLLKADMQIALQYAKLVPDEAIRERIFNAIAAEFSRTEHAILAITGQKALLENEPVLARSVQLRNPYIDPLNYIQVEMIRRLRGLPDKTTPEADELRAVIELTINGVSGGLKNTG